MNSEANQNPAQEEHDLRSPGAILRAARLEQGLDEKAVADRLHITMHYVRSLEADCYEKLPGAVFAKGYMKSYANLLGLNAAEVLANFDYNHAGVQAEAVEAQRKQVKLRHDRNRPWVYASLAVFVVGFVGLWLYNRGGEEAGAVPATADSPAVETPDLPQFAPLTSPDIDAVDPVLDTPVVTQPDPVVEAVPASTPEAAPTNDFISALSTLANGNLDTAVDDAPVANQVQAPAASSDSLERLVVIETPGEDVLRISFSGECWVQVDDSDANPLYRDIREAGDVLEITGSAPFNILLGDAPLARMTLNGNEIDVTDNIRIDNSARLTVGL